MKQQINLYLPEFRLKKDAVTPLLMGQILGAMIILMVLVSAFDIYRQWSLQSELAALEVTLQEETRQTEQLDEQLARRSQDTALTDRLEMVEARLEASMQIQDFLSRTQLGNVIGFSEFFKDLSRASFDGISITEFEFSEGGRSVVLQGQAMDSAMVPRFVDNIERGESPLKSHRFSPLISRSDVTDQIFQFELVTNRE
jgi:hypothetical protein